MALDAHSSAAVAAPEQDGASSQDRALTARWRGLAESAAEALAAALRAGAVPRVRRAQARALLAEAYARFEAEEAPTVEAQAVEAQAVEAQAVEAQAVEAQAALPRRALAAFRRLAFALDRAATPPTRPIPPPVFRGGLRAPGAVDRRRVARIVGYWEWAEGLTARSAAFLEAAGFGAGGGLGLRTAREVVEGAPPEVDRVLTDG